MYKIRFCLSILIFVIATIGAAGIFYPLPYFDIQFAPLLQRVIVDFSVISVVLIVIMLLTALVFGRVYCSLLCPFGIFQELTACFRKKNNEEKRINLPVKYFIAAITFGSLIGGSAVLIRYIEPYTFFGSVVSLSLIGICAFIIVGLITIFKNRYFCTNICPVGCVLGLLSKISLLKIFINKQECVSCGLCERNCPAGCIDSQEKTVDNETCLKCLKCLDVCHKSALKYAIKPEKEVKFSIKRRKMLTMGAAILIFAGAVKVGIDLSKSAAKKIRNIILPAGAVNTNRMFHKCLNCNLCIKACPNNILTKADSSFGTVHIDYNLGKKYCKYNCIQCSKVCPSGAIKKISLEEKRKIRIAMAVINSEQCNKCGLCYEICPAKAIVQEKDNRAKIDASKCIGCNKCRTICQYGAIEIFAINEQQSV